MTAKRKRSVKAPVAHTYTQPTFFIPALASPAQLEAWQERLAAHVAACRRESPAAPPQPVDRPVLRVLCVLPDVALSLAQQRRVDAHIDDVFGWDPDVGSSPLRPTWAVEAEAIASMPLQERLRCHAQEHCGAWLTVDFMEEAGMLEGGCDVEVQSDDGLQATLTHPWSKLADYDVVFVPLDKLKYCIRHSGAAHSMLRLLAAVSKSRLCCVLAGEETSARPEGYPTVPPTLLGLLARISAVLAQRQSQLRMPWAAAPRELPPPGAADALVDRAACGML